MNTESLDHFRNISSLPEEISVAAAICRIVDGVGFRYFRATESLKPGDDR